MWYSQVVQALGNAGPRIIHRHKEISKKKIGRGYRLIPRLSSCSMNTLNRHTHDTLISCLGFDISGSPWPLIANFKLNINIQCTDFNHASWTLECIVRM